ncbi:DNA polymerase III subunit alpha [Thermicanus aegyptius]|uniref:DNA polymerase III subunit alpha n=1 Tax=Thermicanus aegyptius TaxID=94009 RepID=UPI000491744D|nr:DNA polymerase III subunit alpha [Thermicanus aegyptius]
MSRYCHLHVHSEYSLLKSAARIEELASQAARMGMKALALTDFDAMYGIIPFYQACKRVGVKPILGLEISMSRKGGEKESIFPLVLLAETYEGYQNLMRLSTLAHLKEEAPPFLHLEELKAHSRGIIALSGSVRGEIPQLLLAGKFTEAFMAALELMELFGKGNFYLSLEDHDLPPEKKANHLLIQLSQRTGIPMVVAHEAYYVHKREAKVQDVLSAIGTGKKLTDPSRERLLTEQYDLKSEEEMVERFSWVKEGLENSVKIAERCRVEIPFGKSILPSFPYPPGKDGPETLRSLCMEGVRERYGDPPPARVMDRLTYELSIIEQMGFTDYFLIVWDFMKYAHEKGIPTGPGRGSAAGSLVAYVLKITNIDPLRYNLFFERFLNPERISMPDIDIDFADDRRDEMIEYVSKKYGADRVAQIITFGTMAARGAVRDVGRVMNFPYTMVDQVAKLIPASLNMTLERALEESEELREWVKRDDQVRLLIEIARSIEGLPRHASTHAAGIVIAKEPLTHYVPLQKGSEGGTQTQYPMEVLEELGLLKMDFLGLRNLTIIQQTVEEIFHLTGKRVDPSVFPKNDPKTYELCSRGETTGVFQLESVGMRNVLRELKPSRFEDLVAVLALYRPGPMENIPLYIKGKQGEIPVTYPHPSLEEILKETYGVIVYQEQIMQIASTMAGYTLGEADLLRRGVGKKKKEILDAERDRFVKGAIMKGYEEETALSVYDLIVRFANYGFNKSHSVAYAEVAYQMAYLKANYPLPFMAALLASVMGNHVKISEYVEECGRMGIKALPPHINKSKMSFTVEEGGIRFGLIAIKNVGLQAIRNILEAREEGGDFSDLYDLIRRTDPRTVNRRVLESLIQAGTLDPLPGHRAQKLAALDELIEFAHGEKREKEEFTLFSGDEPLLPPPLPEIEPFTKDELLSLEREYLGLSLSGHPLDEFGPILSHPKVTPIAQLPFADSKEKVFVAGVMRGLKPISTRKGEPMAFARLEDKSGSVDVIFFPKIYAGIRFTVKEEALLLVEGRVQKEEESVKLVGERIWKLKDLLPKFLEGRGGGDLFPGRRVYIKITKAHKVTHKVEKLERLLLTYPGDTPILLYDEEEKVTKQLSAKYNVTPSLALIREVGNLLGPQSIVVKEN